MPPVQPPDPPQSPPSMPGAGWYPDPGQAATWRYWDGAHWTNHVAPMHIRTPRDPYSFGVWFEQATELVKATLRRVGVVVLIVHLAAYGVVTAIAFAVLAGRTGDRLDALVDHLEAMFDGSDEITDAQWDRAGDLFGDVVGPLAAIALLGIVLIGVVTLWTVALAARAAWDATSAKTPAGKHSIVQSRSLATSATARFPAVLASALAFVAIGIAVVAAPLAPFALALAAGAGPATIGITATLGFLAAAVLACWVGGRLSLSLPLAARGGHGFGIVSSWRLTDGHYWPVVGRLLIAGLLASVVTLPFGFSNGVTFIFGAWVGITFIVLGQALGGAASVLLVTPAQVMTIEHLEAQRATDPASPIVGG